MKILQVIDTLNVGGAERVFVDVCNVLICKKIDVSVLFLLDAGVLNKDLNPEIPVFELHRKNKWNLSSMKQCSKIISQYDIVHCHFRHVYRYISLVSKLFSVKSKIILQDHYGLIDIDKKKPFLFSSILKPKYYIGVSKTLTNWAIDSLKMNPNKVFILQNIIIKQNIQTVENKEIDLLLVSNIKPVKNNFFAIEIAEKCNLSITLIGKNQDDIYFEKIKNYTYNSIEILENVSNAQEFLAQAKLGLHTSKSETGPLVLIEYLAQGLPFLAYETGEVAKILKPYFPEYFVDNFEIEKWFEQINFLMKQKPDKEKMNAIFEKYFGVEQYFNKLNEIYLCILND